MMPSPSKERVRGIPSDQDAKDAYFRQLYSEPPDFKALALLDPDFSAVVKGRALDFRDPKAVVQLTRTLLKTDFGLDIRLPDDRLCPAVANRHNYILWLKDLLDSTGDGADVVGLDIGTGASCIYPLLGCTQRPWSFIATDIDEESLACARENVARNGLEARVQVVPRGASDPLVPLADDAPPLAFAMTNPPFYASRDAVLRSAGAKAEPPAAACTGADAEMLTPGGEVAFVARLLDESLSLRLRGRVRWYTAMLGFRASVASVVGLLRDRGVGNYALAELVQGARTKRWVVGWSFAAARPSQAAARGAAASLRSLLPPATECVAAQLQLPLPGPGPGPGIAAFAEGLAAAIARLELLSWRWEGKALEGVGRAGGKVWARAWRRRRKREAETEEEAMERTDDGGECAFGFKVAVRATTEHLAVECRWLEGHDESAFESFRGYLKSTAQQVSQQPSSQQVSSQQVS